MKYFEFDSIECSSHFSVEQFLIEQKQYTKEPAVLIWRNDKTVMLGNNQLIQSEVDLEYTKEKSIKVIRRRSGGGCIYTDLGTIQYTIIMPYDKSVDISNHLQEILSNFILDALSHFGIDAEFNGRNDIVHNNKKISGLAQYVFKDAICSHGSLLYDVNKDDLIRSLIVDEGKLQSKGIQSIKSRIMNLKELFTDPDDQDSFFEKFRKHVKNNSNSCITLPENEKITELKEMFESKEWIYSQNPAYTFSNKFKFESGTVNLYLLMDSNNIIKEIAFRGDFLGNLDDIKPLFLSMPYTKETINKHKNALMNHPVFCKNHFSEILLFFGF